MVGRKKSLMAAVSGTIFSSWLFSGQNHSVIDRVGLSTDPAKIFLSGTDNGDWRSFPVLTVKVAAGLHDFENGQLETWHRPDLWCPVLHNTHASPFSLSLSSPHTHTSQLTLYHPHHPLIYRKSPPYPGILFDICHRKSGQWLNGREELGAVWEYRVWVSLIDRSKTERMRPVEDCGVYRVVTTRKRWSYSWDLGLSSFSLFSPILLPASSQLQRVWLKLWKRCQCLGEG